MQAMCQFPVNLIIYLYQAVIRNIVFVN